MELCRSAYIGRHWRPSKRDQDRIDFTEILESIFHPEALTEPNCVHEAKQHKEDLQQKLREMQWCEITEQVASSICSFTNKIQSCCHFHTKVKVDTDETARTISGQLYNYEMVDRVLIVAATLGEYYGDFWLVARLYTTENPPPKSVTGLRRLPHIMEHIEIMRPRYEAVVEFIKLLFTYILFTTSCDEVQSEFIDNIFNWLYRGVVACATQIVALISSPYCGDQHPTTKAYTTSRLGHSDDLIFEELRMCTNELESLYKIQFNRRFRLGDNRI